MTRGEKYTRADVIHKSSGLKQMARSIARRRYSALARQVMRNPKTRDHCLNTLEKDIQKELTCVVSLKKGTSCLRYKSLQALQSFTWEKLHRELKVKAPTLHQVLMGCINVRQRERVRKGPHRKSTRVHKHAVLGICAAILLRHRNQNLNLVQRLLSLILNSGHAGKQVCFG